MVAPARDPRRAPRHPRRPVGPARPDLRVVGRRPARARRPGVRLSAGLLALFLALFGNAVAHSVLVSGQERLDGLNTEVEREQARNERLQLRAAKLEAPDRVVNAAKGMGMIPAQETTWLQPSDDPGSVAATTESHDGTGGDGTGSGDAGTNELAGTGHDGTDPASR